MRITGSRQESDLSLQCSTCRRINKNIFVSVWEPLGCTVLRHLAAAGNPTPMFIQVMTWASSTPVCRQQEPGAIGIFEHLRSVNWHFLKMKSFWVDCPREKAPWPQIVLAWALAVGPDNVNKLWAWLTALSETVKKTETPMTAFTFRSCWWNYQSLMPKTAENIFYHVGFKIHINRQSSIFHIAPQNTSLPQAYPSHPSGSRLAHGEAQLPPHFILLQHSHLRFVHLLHPV